METLRWQERKLYLLDQTRLPLEKVELECTTYQQVIEAIKILAVRGAPAIGVAAAYGLVLGLEAYQKVKPEAFVQEARRIAAELDASRPTAVNLHWALQRMLQVLISGLDSASLWQKLEAEARKIEQEDFAANRKMGEFGQTLIPAQSRILTHCNAGALATSGWGTALGVIRSAQAAGKQVQVYADETRPLLQGARLTALELLQDRIDVTLISDNLAATLMAHKMVDLVIVGADRIAANGDAANKIGTYGLAVLAEKHNLPFYIAAPLSTFDLSKKTGAEIPIEQRKPEEVTHLAGQRIAPLGVKVWNPAFDVTPSVYIKAIITEKGIIYPPYEANIRKIMIQ
ncbi:MAG: S-methyl-5-thioribose-1-phosphate isomerase [Clostridia bacterium]|nr:S-methyl-5-thioribose-1-phosphate isomerase [Clostridia bacterium]